MSDSPRPPYYEQCAILCGLAAPKGSQSDRQQDKGLAKFMQNVVVLPPTAHGVCLSYLLNPTVCGKPSSWDEVKTTNKVVLS